MPNDIAVIDSPPSDLAVARPPEVVLQEAKKAADALKDVISKKHKPVIFNNEQYLEFEDWQTVGNFYGLKAKTGEAEPVTIDGIAGAKAKAEVIDIRSGRVVGGAEAYCLRDEPNWARKPWFQLASMAQTRAGSKSLRNILAWVVVLAGYRPTPAEEMEGVIKPTIPQVRPRNDATMVRPATDRYTGELLKPEEDGAGYAGSGESVVPQKASTSQQASDAPPAPMQSGAELARKIANNMDEQYEDGFIGKLHPYPGTTAYQSKVKPGYFDLEDGQGGLVKKFKYFDPALEMTSGLKRVYYRTENYQGKTSYAATKIEALD